MARQDALFGQANPNIRIPQAVHFDRLIGKTKVFQSYFEGYTGRCHEHVVKEGDTEWTEAVLPSGHVFRIVQRGSPSLLGEPFLRNTAEGLRWEGARVAEPDQVSRREALDSWKEAFIFREEDREAGVSGLRTPQIGALHAIHAHWTVDDVPAMIVMPTGTGKTETMLATLVSQRCERVLVIVPSLILRDQLFGKFTNLGLLKKLGVLSPTARLPVVGQMRGSIETPEEVDQIFGACNVVVAVINSVAKCPEPALQRLAELCTHLFIDEAHHVPAATWSRVKGLFQHKRVLQFTATPYRNDGKRVDGKVIYAFPLRKAQEQGYFKPIRYLPVVEFLPERSDRAIAEAAIGRLREDLAGNTYDHILMARAHPIPRLESLIELYNELAPDLNPVIIHSEMNRATRDAAFASLRSRRSRIVLCDNMLGEGFDFPQLKVAALHDLHKSLAITLQFTGRFTRTNEERLGDATMVANAALSDVSTALRDLYAQDADWNRLVQEMADQAIGSKVKKTEFSASFQPHGVDFPAENIQPKMSMVVYKTQCEEWSPDRLSEWLEDKQVFAGPSVSPEHNAAFFVVVNTTDVEWGLARDAVDVHYSLYLLHWSRDQNLLFINSTDNQGFQADLAELVCGDTVERVTGEPVFRALYGINRLVLMNLGLKSVVGRSIKFTMLAGSDVLEGITPAQAGTKTKTNLFALGYEDGERATLGCSLKGRLWSYRVAEDISEWAQWCQETGTKLLNEDITIEEINRWFVIPTVMTEQPDLIPLDIDWSDELYVNRWGRADVRVGQRTLPFFDVAIDIRDQVKDQPLQFVVGIDGDRAIYQVDFGADGPLFSHIGGATASVIIGGQSQALEEFCQKYPPTIYFENEAVMERGLLFTPHREGRVAFDTDRITAREWTDINIRKESQGAQQDADSIQADAIRVLRETRDFEIIFDDDDANEIADIVCLKREGKELVIELQHCKFSSADAAGARVKDLYEVCGQAQKSIKWRERIPKMIRRLGEREARRTQAGLPSRFAVGDMTKLLELQNAAHLLRPKVSIAIVQPGLSKARVSAEQLELLGATQNYLRETYQIPFEVICSA